MYAEAGQVKQAQQVLLEALKFDPSLQETGIWYGYARLAENYGEYDAAARLYRKVEKPQYYEGEPNATYALAQNRLLHVGAKDNAAGAAK
jgi:Tfp pilus assembly protein PilF